MTLHKSKGLEFDHVFIVGCGQRDQATIERFCIGIGILKTDF